MLIFLVQIVRNHQWKKKIKIKKMKSSYKKFKIRNPKIQNKKLSKNSWTTWVKNLQNYRLKINLKLEYNNWSAKNNS